MSSAGKHRLAQALPAEVAECAASLRRAGGRAWVVGGAVRDALSGFDPDDWDLATDLPPDQVAALFPGATVRDLHLGVLAVPGPQPCSVASLRRESGYRDRRRPDNVEFDADPEQDAARRDFTCNAIYWDPASGELLDPFGGAQDLARGVLRTIGDPAARCCEDPLRMLRAIRFAARLDLQLGPDLDAAIPRCAALLGFLAVERVFDELTRMFLGPGRGRALRLLVDLGLAAVVLPEVVPMDGVPQPPEYHPEGDVLTHVVAVLDQVVAGDPVQAWAAVLHDVGKPPTFERASDRIRFTGHDVLSADMADRALRRLRASRELRETVVEIARDHIRMASLPEMRVATRERWLRSPRFAAHLAFHRADCLGSHRKLGIWELATEWLAALPPLPPPPLVRGEDVLALGVAPGPEVGVWLRRVEDHAESQGSRDRAAALAWLAQQLRSSASD